MSYGKSTIYLLPPKLPPPERLPPPPKLPPPEREPPKLPLLLGLLNVPEERLIPIAIVVTVSAAAIAKCGIAASVAPRTRVRERATVARVAE